MSDKRGNAKQGGNFTNQCNPNHKPTGPGHNAGYKGAEFNRDNRANQLNPNNDRFQGGQGPEPPKQ